MHRRSAEIVVDGNDENLWRALGPLHDIEHYEMTNESKTAFVAPERMWFADTGMGGFLTADRTHGDNSAFAHWLTAGRLFVRPWVGRPDQYDTTLHKMMPGDPVFAYESGVGIVAIGRVRNPKDLRVGEGATELFPKAGAIVKELAVDWDTSVTRTVAQVSSITGLGGPALKSCGSETVFFPMAVAMLREAHDRHHADPDALEAAAVARVRANPSLNATMRDQQIRARVGQGAFRKAVLAREPACRLTGITHKSCLVASHIKPWAVCDETEHLDGANGLMLAPHADHLFDTGLISFEDNGQLLVAQALDVAILRAWYVDARQNVGPFAPDQARYLRYHREHVFGCARPRRQRNLVGDVPDSAVVVFAGPALGTGSTGAA